MERRKFLNFLGYMVVNSFLPVRILRISNNFEKWIWMDLNCDFNPVRLRSNLIRLREAGFKRVLLQVYTGGTALFETDLFLDNKCDILPKILKITNELNIDLHAWMWTVINPSRTLIEKHPEWYMVNRQGLSSATHPPYVSYYNWMCPSKEEVRNYIKKVVDNLLQFKDIKGIHFDYIRYPDVILPEGIQPRYNLKQTSEEPEFDFCYCENCRRLFENMTGIDPMNIESPDKNREWIDFRVSQITNLVNTLAKHIKSHGKVTSAAVFATPSLAEKYVRQRWYEWNLDYVFPMIYHRFYNKPLDWIYEATKEGKSAINNTTKLISGLFLYHIMPNKVSIAFSLAEKGGASGVCLFSYRMFEENEEYLKVLNKV